MPKRVTTIYICSLCRAETDQASKVTEYQITGPGRPLNFDICTACAEVGPFRDLLDKGIRERGAPKAAKSVREEVLGSGEYPCKVCGESFGAPQGKAAHERWCGKSPAEIKAMKTQIRAARAANR